MQEKVKRKADKLTKQSFALLDRLKERKEKKAAVSNNEENYIEDLYFKIFGKCSPHFNKMESSNEILALFKEKEKTIGQMKVQQEMNKDECRDLRLQVGRLKESKDDMGRMKALNEEITLMEEKVQKLNQQIKKELQEKITSQEQIRFLKEEHQSLKNTNEELQELVQKLSAELEAIANEEPVKEESKFMPRSISGEMEGTLSENQAIKAQNQQLMKDKNEMSEKVHRLQKDLQSKKVEIKNLQEQHEKIVKRLKEDIQKLGKESKDSKLTLSKLQSDKVSGHNTIQGELQEVKKSLLLSELDLSNLKKDHERVKSENSQKVQKYQEQKTVCMAKIQELSVNYEKKESELIQQKKRYQDEINKQTKGIYKLNQNILNLQGQLRQYKNKNHEFQNSLQTLREKNFELQTINGVLRSELDSTVTNADQMSKKVSEKDSHSKAMNKQIEDIRLVVEGKQKEVSDLKEEVSKLKKTISNLQEQLSISSSLNDDLKKEFQIFKKNNKDKDAGVLALKQEYETKIEEITERCKFFKESNQELNNDKVDLIANIEVLAEEIKRLNELIDQQKGRYEKQLEQKEKEYQNMKKTIRKPSQSFEEELLIEMSDKVDTDQHQKVSKHIETIEELTRELTEAFNTIGSLEGKIKELEASSVKKERNQASKSPDPQNRGRSIKKFFGL